ncbi:MAG: PAS domain S-box protein, partial [Desulfuromonadaceae bacterium]|nr:PAS domain S-box protein [Desulfuromonadaceae bacterium]
MNYRLLSIMENPPEGFQYSPNLAQRDVRRWPFALLASSREEADRILAHFGSSLTGIIVTFGPRYTWHQCAPLLFHLTVPNELQANLEQLLLSHLSLLDNWQQAENRSIEQTLKFQRAREESYRSRQEFALVKESLMEELSIRRQVEETVREREAHYRLLTENVDDVVWKADRDYRLTYISPADERLRGYNAEEVIGRHALELFTEEAIAELTETLRQRQVAELSGIRTGTITFEAQQLCKDGSWVWVEINSTPERGVDGTIVGYHGISREITKRKYTENKFRMLFDLSPIGMAMVDNETG